MMLERHRTLLMQLNAAAAFALPSYTGSHAIFGDEKQGYIECYGSGEITFPLPGTVDVFILGSGLRGGSGNYASYSSNGGKGGKGAVGTTLTGVNVEGEYTITVGAACSSTTGANKSTAFGTTANSTTDNGGQGGYVQSPSTVNAGSKGSDGTSYPFGETSGIFYKQFGAGGGGGGTACNVNGYYTKDGGAGGNLGGGKGVSGTSFTPTSANSGTANTGSGGGGCSSAVDGSGSNISRGNGGNGGSGIVIVRWGYDAA